MRIQKGGEEEGRIGQTETEGGSQRQIRVKNYQRKVTRRREATGGGVSGGTGKVNPPDHRILNKNTQHLL